MPTRGPRETCAMAGTTEAGRISPGGRKQKGISSREHPGLDRGEGARPQGEPSGALWAGWVERRGSGNWKGTLTAPGSAG